MANVQMHVTAASPQANYMWRNTSSEMSLSGTHLTTSHLSNWKERGGRWETRHTCLCHHPTFTEIVFIMLWFPKEFCSRSFKFLHTPGALWGFGYLITTCKQLSGYSVRAVLKSFPQLTGFHRNYRAAVSRSWQCQPPSDTLHCFLSKAFHFTLNSGLMSF